MRSAEIASTEQFLLENGRTVDITHLNIPLDKAFLANPKDHIDALLKEANVPQDEFFFYRTFSRDTSSNFFIGRTFNAYRRNLKLIGIDKPMRSLSDFFMDVGQYSPAYFRLNEVQNSKHKLSSGILIYNPDLVLPNPSASGIEKAQLFQRMVNRSILRMNFDLFKNSSCCCRN
jgi:hypothetical protein